MKVKTSELTGQALCYAVCMIEMPHLVWGKTSGIHHASNQIVVPELPEPKCYSPFTGWDMCGPIIERERITLTTDAGEWLACFSKRLDTGGDLVMQTEWVSGDTPLIAAMRCYVASKLGEEVDIPEELC